MRCQDYINFLESRQQSRKWNLLEFLQSAWDKDASKLKSEDGSLHISRSREEEYRKKPDPDRIQIIAFDTFGNLVSLACQLAWLTACLRTPDIHELKISDVSLKLCSDNQGGAMISISSAALRDIPSSLRYNDTSTDRCYTCWHPLFKGFALASGFPVPDRDEEYHGLEIHFEAIISLARIWHCLDCLDTTILVGYSTALIPTRSSEDSIQWHFIFTEGEEIRMEMLHQYCKGTGTVHPDHIRDDKRRHFIGLWEQAEIHLGTTNSGYGKFLNSETEDFGSRPIITRELAANLGTSAHGLITLTVNPKLLYPTAPRVELAIDNERLADLARNSKKAGCIIYDVDTALAWYVSEISVLYHVLLAWAALQDEPHCSELLSKIPVIPVASDGGEAVRKLLSREGIFDKVIIEKKGSEPELLLMDLVKNFAKSFYARKRALATRVKEGIPIPGRGVLCGWELTEVACRKLDSSMRTVKVRETSGGWETLSFKTSDTLVFFCKQAGYPIRPRTLHQACTTWTPGYANMSYLIASVPSVMDATRSFAGRNDLPRLSQTHFLHRNPSAKLFDICSMDGRSRCNRLLHLSRTVPLHRCRLFFEEEGANGAVVVGNAVRSKGACQPFGQLQATKHPEPDLPGSLRIRDSSSVAASAVMAFTASSMHGDTELRSSRGYETVNEVPAPDPGHIDAITQNGVSN